MFSSNTSQQSEGYQIQRSLRFNSADSTYLNRTPASAGNRKTWTWSGWVKFCKSGWNPVFSIRIDGNNQFFFNHNESDQIRIYDMQSAVFSFDLVTTQVFRDYSAWYHLVFAVDTTQATAANRLKLYVNGNQVTAFNTASYPSQNTDLLINSTNNHLIGNFSTAYANAYMTEVNFIDGQALTPSSFGQTNANTGVWEPKPYAGTYGTNGFYLNFSDNSNTTATTLGKDYSGNGNNWTPNNFSVSAGAGNDSVVDVPTAWGTDTGVGGTVRGNYCTFNPLNLASGASLVNGNLDGAFTSASAAQQVFGTMAVSSGKWYFEVVQTALGAGAGSISVGVANITASPSVNNFTNGQAWLYYGYNGNKYNTSAVSYGATYGTGSVVGVALDLDAGTITFYKDGVSQGTAFTNLAGNTVLPIVADDAGNVTKSFTLNAGQRPFAYTAPSGFKALCTQNLPTPTIGATAATQAGKYFNAITWTGNDVANRTFTGVGFQPDFVWAKSRSGAYSHLLYDVLRGTGANTELTSNATAAEGGTNADTYGYLTAFASDGFTTSNSYPNFYFNSNNETYVAWNWKANGAGVTNTAGSITSTVSANTTSGFSVVTFTGNGGTASTVGHGLGSAPKFIIQKRRNDAGGWNCYHASLPVDYRIDLNTTAAATYDPGAWNATRPTSSVYSIQNPGNTNISGATYVAYCFAEVQGFSKAFSYTGNGSADGAFVFTGMRPAYVLLKRTDTTSNWTVLDFKRLGYNVDNNLLYPNLSDAEGTTDLADLLSNGFKLRSTDASVNANGGTYIGFAFAESPFKYALAR